MVKILLTSLASLLLVSGMAGVTVVAAKEINMDEPLNALQTWSRLLVQEQVELQVQQQPQVRLEAGQPESSPEVPEQTRLRLENQEMLQIQDRIQSQEQIQLQQEVRLQNGTGYRWGTDTPDNSYEPGSSPKPALAPQTGDGLGTQQRRKP
jgi:hypothetical protein